MNQTIYRTAWGVDIGRSAIKLCGPSGAIAPVVSSVSPALRIDDSAERARAEQETVIVNGTAWWFGETASVQAGTEPGLSVDFHRTTEYEVLVAASCKIVGKHGPVSVVGGLPSEASEQDRLDTAAMFVRYLPPGSLAKIVPQPAGVYFSEALRDTSLQGVTVVVVDVGRYSTDLAAIRNGRPIQSAFRSAGGVRIAVDHLRETLRGVVRGTPSYERIEKALLTGKLVYMRETFDVTAQATAAKLVLMSEVSNALAILSTKLRGEVDTVLLSGGGSELITIDNVRRSGRNAVACGLAYLAQRASGSAVDGTSRG